MTKIVTLQADPSSELPIPPSVAPPAGFPKKSSEPTHIWQWLNEGELDVLHNWMFRGRRFGLLDVDVVHAGRSHPHRSHITIWVRESADPAYVIRPGGRGWSVTDSHGATAWHASFSAVLNAIRRIATQ